MSTKPKWQPGPSEITALPSLPKIEPLSPPTFPTFQQLVEADRVSQQSTSSVPKKMNDLFDGILGTLEPLLADFQENPEKYGEETHELLGQLTLGSKSLEQLSPNERRLLNLATFDFYQAPKPKPAEEPELLVKEAEAEDEDTLDELEEEAVERLAAKNGEGRGPIPGVDVPVTELPAYWWLS